MDGGESSDKARNSYAQSDGRKIGLIAFNFLLVVLVIFDIFLTPPRKVPRVVFWRLLCHSGPAGCYAQYRYSKRKSHLAFAIICPAACIANLIAHVFISLK